MSNFRGHAIGGLVSGVAYLSILSIGFGTDLLHHHGVLFNGWTYAVAIMMLTTLFALWPDVDTNSKAQDMFFTVIFVFDIWLIYLKEYKAAAFVGLIGMLPIVGKHRGWTHRFWAMLIVPLPLLLIPYTSTPGNKWSGITYYIAAILGYFNHLLLDGLVGAKLRRMLRG